MKISIIVAARNEEDHIEDCINSLLKQSFQNFEILIIDGLSDDNTLTIAKSLGKKDNRIKVYSNKLRFASHARNIGISKAKGEYICYIDAHTTASKDWLKQLFSTLEKHRLWHGKKVGGVGSIHKNPNKEKFSFAVTMAFQNPFGGGGSSYRVGGKLRSVDTAYACLYTKEALQAIKFSKNCYYDPYFIKGQDADLNWRINRAGFVLLQQPKALTFYAKRKTFKGFWRQMFVAGFWRAKLTMKHPSLIKPTLFAPLLFYLSLVALIIIGHFISSSLIIISCLLLLSYLFGILLSSAIVGKKYVFLVSVLVVTIHVAFSLGLVKGFLFKQNNVRDRV